MNPTYDFTGKVALVTGASSGMGLATAQAFAESGAAVVLADINDEFLQAATAGLRARGHQVLGGSAIQRDWPTPTGNSSATRPLDRHRVTPQDRILRTTRCFRLSVDPGGSLQGRRIRPVFPLMQAEPPGAYGRGLREPQKPTAGHCRIRPGCVGSGRAVEDFDHGSVNQDARLNHGGRCEVDLSDQLFVTAV